MKWICYDGEYGANNIFHLQIMCFSAVPITESRITGSVYYMKILGIIIKTKIRGKYSKYNNTIKV